MIAAVTGVGIGPGECWPARFWVLSVPMLAVGFCIFWELARSVLLRGIAIFLIGATLVNTVIFVRAPNSFLENRQTGATYQYLFEMLGHVDFALMLPVETDDDVNVDAARNLAIGGAAIVLLLAVALARRQPLYAAPVVLLLLVALDLSRVRVLPARDYVAAIYREWLQSDVSGARTHDVCSIWTLSANLVGAVSAGDRRCKRTRGPGVADCQPGRGGILLNWSAIDLGQRFPKLRLSLAANGPFGGVPITILP